MIVAQHNCSNQDDSEVGSRGSAKWNEQMATERKKSKGNIHLGFQFKTPIHIFANQINFSSLKLLTFAAISLTICFQAYYSSLCLIVPEYSMQTFCKKKDNDLAAHYIPSAYEKRHCRLTEILF